MLGFFGMTVGMKEDPGTQLFPGMLLVYWTAYGFPVDGFTFTFYHFYIKGCIIQCSYFTIDVK